MSAVMSEPLGSHFPPGALVRARGREWIVLPGSSPDRLRLRPLSGSEADVAVVSPRLEAVHDPVVAANFPPPSVAQAASHEDA